MAAQSTVHRLLSLLLLLAGARLVPQPEAEGKAEAWQPAHRAQQQAAKNENSAAKKQEFAAPKAPRRKNQDFAAPKAPRRKNTENAGNVCMTAKSPKIIIIIILHCRQCSIIIIIIIIILHCRQCSIPIIIIMMIIIIIALNSEL